MKIGLLIGLLLGAVLVASCSVPNVPATSTPPVLEVETSTAPTVENAQVYQVAIENGNLMPVDIEINAGDTVEWVNKDTVRYTLQFGSFEERLPMGGMFEYTFTQTGTVRYSLFQGKFKSSFVGNNEYLLHVSVYVNLNFRVHRYSGRTAELVRSSWDEYMGNAREEFCQKEIILGQFRNVQEYEHFAEQSLKGMVERKQLAKDLFEES